MLLDWFQKTVRVEPYSQLACIYDFVMRHVDYTGWAEYLIRLFSKTDFRVTTVLDISCGTGSLALNLQRSGFQVSAFDSNVEMVKIAKRKANHGRVALPLWCGSMTGFSVAKQYHTVISTYDSMNYCLEKKQCCAVFKHVLGALVTGGLFIFDICTIRNSKRHFLNYYEKDDLDDCHYIRQSSFSFSKRIQINEFYINWNHSEESFHEIHQQRIYSIREMIELIPEQFELQNIYDGFTLRPGSEKSDRVQFVLKKRSD